LNPLLHHSEKEGMRVHEVSEHYTSKACGHCGCIDRKLGGKEWFTCPNCEFSLPRDYNGARNIFLMNVYDAIGNVTRVTEIPMGSGPGTIETLDTFDHFGQF